MIISNVFTIVPIATLITGIKNPEITIAEEKSPARYPIMVLQRQLNPNGTPEIKSTKRPETNPIDSPYKEPFTKER